jgi:(E)-4-hydroxy-3-methylbut-2-enyl-diphosphate synthase
MTMTTCLPFDPYSYQRRKTQILTRIGAPGVLDQVEIGGESVIKVAISAPKMAQIAHKVAGMGDFKPDFVYDDAEVLEVDPRDPAQMVKLNALTAPSLIAVKDGLDLPAITAYRLLAAQVTAPHPIVLKDTLHASTESQADFLTTLLTSSSALGSLICDGIGDAILVQGEVAPGQSLRLAFNILQASGARIFKTDYVACPSCGRTLFDLQTTTARVKASTQHLKGVRIAIMGCIVNGPGEMADADFGYVGGAPGKINLYVGKQPVKFNIPEGEAVERLVDLIREHGKWVDAPEPAAVTV